MEDKRTDGGSGLARLKFSGRKAGAKIRWSIEARSFTPEQFFGDFLLSALSSIFEVPAVTV